MIRRAAYRLPLMAVLLLAGMALAHAGSNAVVIHLKHRPADEIIPLIQPIIEKEGGVVTGSGYKLIVEQPDKDAARIKGLINEIDLPPQRLLITVEHTLHASPAPAAPGSTRIISTDNDSDADKRHSDHKATHVYHTRPRNEKQPQQIRVMEGHWASIQVTQRIPVVEGYAGVVNGQDQLLNTITYKELVTGFAVRAWVQGDQVVVDIAPRREKLDPGQGGVIDTQEARTTVNGKLGQWIDIGATIRKFARHEDKSVRDTDHLDTRERHILVKVEKL